MLRRVLVLLLATGCGSLTPPGGVKTSTQDTGPVTGVATGTASGTASGTGGGAGTGGTGTGTGTPGCAPIDTWDDEASFDPGVGDSCDEAVAPFGPLDDSGAAATTVAGNIHVDGDVDWYRVDAVDLPGDEARGYEDFHLQIKLVDGSSDVEFTVQRTDCAAAVDCDPGVGLDEYSFFNEGITGSPADSRACAAVGGLYDECPDYSGSYLVRVSSISGLEVCGKYTLEISNGVW